MTTSVMLSVGYGTLCLNIVNDRNGVFNRITFAADAQDTIHELELQKIGLLQENTNLTDRMRELITECRNQENDLNKSRKAVVGIHCI